MFPKMTVLPNRFARAGAVAGLSLLQIISAAEAQACGTCWDQQILWTLPNILTLSAIAICYFPARKIAGIKYRLLGPVTITVVLGLLFFLAGGSLMVPLTGLILFGMVDFLVVFASLEVQKEPAKKKIMGVFGIVWLVGIILTVMSYQPGKPPPLHGGSNLPAVQGQSPRPGSTQPPGPIDK